MDDFEFLSDGDYEKLGFSLFLKVKTKRYLSIRKAKKAGGNRAPQ